MKNNQTRELLYDYARGVLSDQERALVEKMLSNSEELRKELKNVQLYYAMIESVEPVSVPGNFLNKVHRRIESSQKKPLFSWLQLPSHIKLPMEFAGILATVVLVVFIFIPELGKKNFSGYEPISPESEAPSIINKPVESTTNENKYTDENRLKTKRMDDENIFEKQRTIIESVKKPDIVPKEEVMTPKPALRSSPHEYPVVQLPSENKNDLKAGIVAAQPPTAEVSIPASAPESQNIPEPEQQAKKQEDAPAPVVAPSAVSDIITTNEITNEFENAATQVERKKERQSTVIDDEETDMHTEEIKRKIVELESKRLKLRRPAGKSSSSDAAYQSHSAKKDASEVYVDAEALMIKYGIKWSVKESLPGTKIYSARGTPKSVNLFLKEIKGKLNVNLIRIVPEDYSKTADSVIVEFKAYKR
jgi:hypothetical protein